MAEAQHRKPRKSKGLSLFSKTGLNSLHRTGKTKAISDDKLCLVDDEKCDSECREKATMERYDSDQIASTGSCHGGNTSPTNERLSSETGTKNDFGLIAVDIETEKAQHETDQEVDLPVNSKHIVIANVDVEIERYENRSQIDVLKSPILHDRSCYLSYQDDFSLNDTEALLTEECEIKSNADTGINRPAINDIEIDVGTERENASLRRCKILRLKKQDCVGSDEPANYEDLPLVMFPVTDIPEDIVEHVEHEEESQPIDKKWRKKRKKKAVEFEIIVEEKTLFCSPSSTCEDSETIEMLSIDEETKKQAKEEKNKKQKKNAKRIAKKAGLTVWKGIRQGWKIIWSGLAMYTLPIGSLDVSANIAKFWSTNSSSKTYY